MNSKVRAVASLLVQAATHIHYIEWDDFSSILKDYPVFREDFLAKMVFSYQIGDVEKVSVIILIPNTRIKET